MSTSIATPTPAASRPPVRRTRRRALIAVTLLAALCAAWSGFWYFVASRTDAAITEAMVREAAAGRTFTCGQRRIFGFPFRIAVRCDELKLVIARPEGAATLTLPRLTGIAQAYDPGHIIIEAQGPLAIDAPGRPGVELGWRSLLASVVPGSSGFPQKDLVVEAPVLHVRDGQNMITANADRLEAHARRDPRRPAQDDAVEVVASLSRLTSPVLDGATGETAPADLSLDASVSQVAALQPPEQETTLPPLERWRLTGGAVKLARASLAKGALKAGFAGDLALDEQHRGTGRLDASIDGADALLPKLGLPPAAAGFLKLNGGSLRLPVSLTNGRLAVGPFAFGRLLPLY